MIKQYEVKVHVDGHYTAEDPKCPSYWRGSGCYDKEVRTWCDPVLDVWANSPEDAKKMAENYDYSYGTTIEIDGVDVRGIKFIAVLDRDEEEAGVIEKTINWKENGDYEK